MKTSAVVINSALYHVIEPFIFITRLAGFLPVSLERSGNIVIIKRSGELCLYSYLLALFLAGASTAGLISDLDPKTSFRLQSGKYVAICDMGDIILCCAMSMLATPFRLHYFWVALEHFNKFDQMVPVPRPLIEKKISMKFMGLFLGEAIFVLAYDALIWAESVGSRVQTFFMRYTAYYILYFVTFIAGVPSWHLTRLIKDRMITLNNQIKSILFEDFRSKLMMNQSQNKSLKLREKIDEQGVNNFMKLYDFLLEACEASNSFCAINVLMILFSCLLHLVVTPYFFLTLLTAAADVKFILLDAFWIWLHMSRLFAIVEGCQGCIDEHQNAVNHVYQLLALDLREEVKEHVASAVGTFVVILFQFGSLGTDQHSNS